MSTIEKVQPAAVVEISQKFYDWLEDYWPYVDTALADATWHGGAYIVLVDVEYNLDMLELHQIEDDYSQDMMQQLVSAIHPLADDGIEYAMLVLKSA